MSNPHKGGVAEKREMDVVITSPFVVELADKWSVVISTILLAPGYVPHCWLIVRRELRSVLGETIARVE